MQKKLIIILTLVFGTTAAFAASIDKLNVDDANDFVLGPSKIEVFADPGETVVRNVTVTNRTNNTVSFKVEMEDFIGSPDPANPLILLGDQRSKYTFVDHIVPEVTQFELEFGERITIPVSIQVPEDASPGGYYTSVIISNEPDKTENGQKGGAISVSRVGALLFIRVNGEVREEGLLEDLRIAGPSKKFVYGSMPTEFEILFSNKGSVHLAPYGKVEVKNMFGKIINAAPVDAFFAMPDSLRQRKVTFEKGGFMFGRYSSTAEIFRGYDDLKDYKTISFWVIPWIVIAIFVLSVSILYGIYKFIGSRFEIKRKMAVVIFSVCAVVPIVALSAVMQSSSYKIQSDSINFAGGLSTSTSYSLEDTVGEIATGYSASTSYLVSAGYQAAVNSSISISSPSDVVLSSIGGVTGGESDGSIVWTVTTSNPTGYTLLVNSDTNPALQSGANTIANYTPATSDPDFTFSVGASTAEFGFTPEGIDIISRFKDNGSACNTGSLDTSNSCYDDFEVSPKLVAATSSANFPSGTATTIKPKVRIGSSVVQAAGTYTATITATAIAF